MTLWFGLSLVMLAADGDARTDRNACGLNSLTLALAFLSDDPDQGPLNDLLPMDQAPFSFADLDGAARRLGYKTYLVRWTSHGAATFDCPAILHIRAKRSSSEPDHFLACFGETAEGLIVAEFPDAPFVLPRHRLERIWDGDVLYIESRDGIAIDHLRRASVGNRLLAACGGMLTLFLVATIGFEVRRGRSRGQSQAMAP